MCGVPVGKSTKKVKKGIGEGRRGEGSNKNFIGTYLVDKGVSQMNLWDAGVSCLEVDEERCSFRGEAWGKAAHR